MPEDSQNSPPDAVTRAINRARYESSVWLHERQGAKQEMAEYIHEITAAAYKHLRVEAMPKVLELTVGQQELVSIRRIDMSQLRIESPKPSDSEELFNMSSKTHIASQWLQNDGDIGIIVSPQIFRAEPTTQKDVDFLNENTKYDDSDGWSDGCKLQHFLINGGDFDLGEWSFDQSPLNIRVVLRKDGKFFTTNYSIPARHRTTNESIEGLMQIRPDGNGMLAVPTHTSFWSEEDTLAQEAVDKKFGIFYAVVVGISEKEQQPEPLKQLVPDYVELPVKNE